MNREKWVCKLSELHNRLPTLRAKRDSAYRIVASRKAGARRARSAPCGMGPGEITSGSRMGNVADGNAMTQSTSKRDVG